MEKFPNGPFAGTARRMIDLSKAKVALAPEDDAKRHLSDNSSSDGGGTPARSENLAADIQRELQRVGCYDGAIDNDWGTGSRNALEEFAQQSGTELTSDEPTLIALSAVKAGRGQSVLSRDQPGPSHDLCKGSWTAHRGQAGPSIEPLASEANPIALARRNGREVRPNLWTLRGSRKSVVQIVS